MENSTEVPKKLKIELPYDPAIPLVGTYPKEAKSGSWRDTCTSMFIAALFTEAKTWKKWLLTNEWTNKCFAHIPTMEYYSAMEKKEILLLSTM